MWKMRQDLGGHNTKVRLFKIKFKLNFELKYGMLIDDSKNILLNDYADMRDRMYDDARQVTSFE